MINTYLLNVDLPLKKNLIIYCSIWTSTSLTISCLSVCNILVWFKIQKHNFSFLFKMKELIDIMFIQNALMNYTWFCRDENDVIWFTYIMFVVICEKTFMLNRYATKIHLCILNTCYQRTTTNKSVDMS